MNRLEEVNTCPAGNEMLEYLYSEISPLDQEAFELHLAECVNCIDEFAELSQSRYPVYEWKRIDFDPLTTPDILITYSACQPSLLDRFTALLGFGRGVVFSGAAVSVVIAVVIAYLIMGPASVVERNDLASADPTASPKPVANISGASRPDDRMPEVSPGINDAEQIASKRVERKPPSADRTSPATTASKSKKGDQTPAQPEPMSIPVLSTAEDFEDDSLRLADLFEEIETSE